MIGSKIKLKMFDFKRVLLRMFEEWTGIIPVFLRKDIEVVTIIVILIEVKHIKINCISGLSDRLVETALTSIFMTIWLRISPLREEK